MQRILIYLFEGNRCKQGKVEYVRNIQLSIKKGPFPCAVVVREYPQLRVSDVQLPGNCKWHAIENVIF